MAESLSARARRGANRLLQPLGLHLARRDRACEMDGLLARAAARGLAIGTWIDVGASDGSWSLRARRHFPDARFLLFEPLAERQPALAALAHQDAVLGPALDGGYVLLGLRRVDDSLFERMPWGSDRVAALTGQRLDALGWHWSRLACLRDIDRPEDLVYLPADLSLPPPA